MKSVFLFFCIGAFGCFSQSSFNVFFNTNSADLRWNDALKFQELLSSVEFKDAKIELVGHTDTTGTAEYNKALSKKRVESVRSFLIGAGIPKDNIESRYVGEQMAESDDQFYNRRVEVTYGKNELSSMEELRDYLSPNEQVFTFEGEGEIEFEGKKGTLIKIDKSNLVNEDGSAYDGSVKITLKEYYTPAEMYADRMFTQSGHEIIETGGMVDLRAFDNQGNPLKLGSGTIELSFPKQSDEQFNTFTGERQEDGTVNWTRNVPDMGIGFTFDGNSISVVDKKDAMQDGEEFEYRKVLGLDSVAYAKMLEEQARIKEKRNFLYNTINAAELGLINCDRFLGEKNTETVELSVSVSQNELIPYSAHLIFKDVRAVLPLTYNEQTNQYETTMIMPKNSKVKLIVVYESRDHKKVFANVEEFYTKPKLKVDAKLEETSFESLATIF